MIAKDGSRWQVWPVRIRFKRGASHRWLARHGWQVGSESVPVEKTSFGCMPGYRAVFGQTLHFGPLKILLGKDIGYAR